MNITLTRRPRRGATLLEYGLIGALIALVVLGIVSQLGGSITGVFGGTNAAMIGEAGPSGGEVGGVQEVEECVTWEDDDAIWTMNGGFYDPSEYFTATTCFTVIYDTTGASDTGQGMTTDGPAQLAVTTWFDASDPVYPSEQMHFVLYGVADVDHFANGATESKAWQQTDGYSALSDLENVTVGDTITLTLPDLMPLVVRSETFSTDFMDWTEIVAETNTPATITLTIPGSGFPTN